MTVKLQDTQTERIKALRAEGLTFQAIADRLENPVFPRLYILQKHGLHTPKSVRTSAENLTTVSLSDLENQEQRLAGELQRVQERKAQTARSRPPENLQARRVRAH